MQAAVLTGDIIHSSSLSESDRDRLLQLMELSFANTKTLLPDFSPEIFQGDSFQGYSRQAVQHSLAAALYLISCFKKEEFGLRVSIGIGAISYQTGSSLTSDGPAFMVSGRNMELLKKKAWQIAVSTGEEAKMQEWEVHNHTLNYLLEKCTAAQAAALVEMLQGHTQQTAADHLGVKQPAIQQRLQAAGWPLLQTILHRFEMQFYI